MSRESGVIASPEGAWQSRGACNRISPRPSGTRDDSAGIVHFLESLNDSRPATHDSRLDIEALNEFYF